MPAAAVRWRRPAAVAGAAAALAACCAVLLLAAPRAPAAASLDEAAALRLAEDGLRRAATHTEALAAARARARAPRESPLAMAAAYFGSAPGPAGLPAGRSQLAQVPDASRGAPVWPGFADFERHEEKMQVADIRSREPHPQALEWNPNCPCRGGCPCPGHGHGSNAVAQAPQKRAAASGELQKGLQEGIALGLRIGLKAGLTEASLRGPEAVQPPAASGTARARAAAGGASAERRFVEKVQRKYETAEHALHEVQEWVVRHKDEEGAATSRKAGAQRQHRAVPAEQQQQQQQQVLSGKAEDKYIKNVEKRFRAEEKTLQPSLATAKDDEKRTVSELKPVSEAAAMAKVQADLKNLDSIADGKASHHSSVSNLPWPFTRSHETPYPEPKDGEYRSSPPMPGKAGSSGAVAGAGRQARPAKVTSSEHQHMLDVRAANQASHAADVDAITREKPFGSFKKAEAHAHLSAKAVALERRARAEASHSADVQAIAKPFSAATLAHDTADFDARGKRLKSQLEGAEGAQARLHEHVADPWLAKVAEALHDASVHPPRTLQQKAADAAWQEKSDEVARQMQAAKGALAAVDEAARSPADVESDGKLGGMRRIASAPACMRARDGWRHSELLSCPIARCLPALVCVCVSCLAMSLRQRVACPRWYVCVYVCARAVTNSDFIRRATHSAKETHLKAKRTPANAVVADSGDKRRRPREPETLVQ
jgi:hypothetical protein